MKRLPSVVSCILGMGLVLAGTPAFGERAYVDREFRESFDVQPGNRLVLRHGNADVSVEAWDEPTLEVYVRYRMEYRERGLGRKARDFTTEFRQLQGDVYVTGRELGKGVRVGFSTMKVYEYRFTVKAPSFLELELEGEDGRVQASDWQGAIDVRLNDGELRLSDVSADLFVTARDAKIEIRGSQLGTGTFRQRNGSFQITDSSGEIEIAAADASVDAINLQTQAVSVSAEEGDVSLDIDTDGSVEIDVSTLSGDATLRLDGSPAARFTLETASGRIESDYPGERLSGETERLDGSLGDGDGTITLRTRSGDIRLVGATD